MYDSKELEIEDKAVLVIQCVRGELKLGTKHYVDGVYTEDVVKIIEGMRDGSLIIEPTPERQHIFKEAS